MAQQELDQFSIEEFRIGLGPVFVIAEIGNNHQGDIDMAKRLIDSAIEAGVDCVKFQLRHQATLYRAQDSESRTEDLGVEYIQDLLNKYDLTPDEHYEIRSYCAARGIKYLCTPWDEHSVDILDSFNVSALKIASADLSNPYLIKKAASLGKPLILSTGMSYESEIRSAVELLDSLSVPYALLHCNSTYPAPDSDIQLQYIQRLRELHPIVGYSGHERGTAITIAAVALGAVIVERHLTLDRSLEGPDHLASLEPKEFRSLVEGIRSVEKALISRGGHRHVSQGELLNRENLAKSITAARQIEIGETFTEGCFHVASPGQGLAPYHIPRLIGKKAVRQIRRGEFLYESDIHGAVSKKREYIFQLKWGIPVRYHDFREFAQLITPDLYEFHLSYRDLRKKPTDFLHTLPCTRLVVHAPELFENSELLDLAAEDPIYRSRSIENLQRVVDATNEIAAFFPNADSQLIVANVGGFSADTPLATESRSGLYERIQESWGKIDWGQAELLPQNMAPFPWHLGGQRYQNVFMMPEEIEFQSRKYNFRICLDLAHLQMTCTHFELDFIGALELLLPQTAHLHVSDAAGSNGEGVPMGSGDIDWGQTWKLIQQANASFIPEIWQGHKSHGAGFWGALDFLTDLN